MDLKSGARKKSRWEKETNHLGLERQRGEKGRIDFDIQKGVNESPTHKPLQQEGLNKKIGEKKN